MLLMPADHIVRNAAAFTQALSHAVPAAQRDHLVTFSITPDSPETGYGYIRRGAPLDGLPDCFSVARFVEKPDAATAAGYLASGDYGWNSGMFVFKAKLFLTELERLEPELLAHCRQALKNGKQDLDFFRLEEASFAKAKSISIDYAVMEHTGKAAMVPVEMGWSDIGSWESLWAASPRDPSGNAVKGDVLQHGTRNSYLRSEGPTGGRGGPRRCGRGGDG